jgi:hypothetical protein
MFENKKSNFIHYYLWRKKYLNLKIWIKQGGSITHASYKLGVVFLPLPKRRNQLNLVQIYVKMLKIFKSYLNILYVILT